MKGRTSWNKGKKASAATRKKISLAKRNPSAETRRKMSLAKKGRKDLAEQMAKIRLAKAKNPSAETRKKISLALKGKTPWNKGRKHSVEHVRKISSANKGQKRSAAIRRKQSSAHNKILTPEYRRKLSLANKGKKVSATTRKKISLAHKGKKLSAEHRRKIGLGGKGKKQSAEHRKKRSLALKGKKLSAEHVKKLSLVHQGQKAWNKGKTGIYSAETIAKIRLARLNQVIPTKDTGPERYLQKLLDAIGIKFTKHKAIFGQPDVFINPNICIFVDGDRWHANPHRHLNPSGKPQSGYKPDDHIIGKDYARDRWARDAKVSKTLKERGYIVLRFWQSQLENNTKKCIQKIIKAMK